MIYFVRHGETDGNTKDVLRGHYFDDELNSKGLTQAQAVAKELQGVKFDLCYCSRLKRAVQTCKPIWKGDVIYDDRLLPRNYGELVGTKPDSAHKAGFYCREKNLQPKGGESILDFENRIRNFLDEVLAKHASQNVLVVTHASLCNMTKGILDDFKNNIESYITKNCEVIRIPN